MFGRFFIIAFVLIATACTSSINTAPFNGEQPRKIAPVVKPPLTTDVHKSFRPEALNYIAIMPLENSPGTTAPVSDAELEDATTRLLKEFQVSTSLQIANLENAATTSDALHAVRNRTVPQQTRAVSFGEKLGAQGVLYGVLNRFDEADGSKLGTTERAAVSFRLYLLDVRANEIAWQATFEESNQPVSENILRLGTVLKEGGFPSATQLLEKGFHSAARKLETTRSGAS